ncbi:MAG: FHA domain-containing protein [Lacipirellulaceae bacterium]
MSSDSTNSGNADASANLTKSEGDESVGGTVDVPEDVLRQRRQKPELAADLSSPSPVSVEGITSRRSTLISTLAYRPTRRGPMAVLSVYDDDQQGAELVRIRKAPFTIGRQLGELVVPNELQMSRRHARIDLVQEGDAWVWYLTDLNSTNGTYIEVNEIALVDRADAMIAGEVVRFEQPSGKDAFLVHVTPDRGEERIPLPAGSHLLGTDGRQCLSLLRGAPYLDPCHVRIECDARGRWRMLDLGSTNGIWRVVSGREPLTNGARFQLGEQRFGFFLP